MQIIKSLIENIKHLYTYEHTNHDDYMDLASVNTNKLLYESKRRRNSYDISNI